MLGPFWSSENRLKPEIAEQCKDKFYTFLDVHLVDIYYGPRHAAYHETIALNARDMETEEERICSRPLLDSIARRDSNLPLRDERSNIIDNMNPLPEDMQPERELEQEIHNDVPPYVPSPSPEPEEMATGEHESPNREGSPQKIVLKKMKQTQNFAWNSLIPMTNQTRKW